jgi:hypothetical protein
MNIVTLFILILGIGALISVLLFTKTFAQNYLEEQRHEREQEKRDKEFRDELFEDDHIDRELEKERNN